VSAHTAASVPDRVPSAAAPLLAHLCRGGYQDRGSVHDVLISLEIRQRYGRIVMVQISPLGAHYWRVKEQIPLARLAPNPTRLCVGTYAVAVPHPLEGTGFVVARRHSDVRVTACTWVSSKWAHRAPADAVLLRVFLGGAHDPGVVSLDDEQLVAAAREDLSRVLGITAAPSLSRVYRWRNAGAQHLVGHLARVEVIEQRLAGHGGLFVAGSGFRSVGIPDCIADARRVAADAATFLRDQPRA
jgi:hypothetical protein